jgi:hypothetical protein
MLRQPRLQGLASALIRTMRNLVLHRLIQHDVLDGLCLDMVLV